MAQVSSNTLTYDQIFIKIKDFYTKNLRNEFPTSDDKLKAYQSLLSDIQTNILKPTVKFDPVIKGEPPSAIKMNKFIDGLSSDVLTISKQIDYLSAKVINTFNLFNSEIGAEKKYLERIASKARILQMYSKAPAENIIYVGDSFDNADFVEVESIPIGQNPHIENGVFTLPINNSRAWNARTISIDTLNSNGFMGNDHQAIINPDQNTQQSYTYVYKSNPSISSTSAIADSNILTYFEYEGLNVDLDSNPNVDKSLLSEFEFSYLANKKIVNDKTTGDLVNWSKFDLDKPLKLVVKIESAVESNANTLTIVPYFGSCKLVKVTSVKAIRSNGSITEILSNPIYIGSSFVPTNGQIMNQYFYDKAILRFADIKVVRFEVSFEQDSYEQIDIMHSYWKPIFPLNPSAEDILNPFYGKTRFNPDALSSDTYELIEYDKYIVTPLITTPNQFKNLDRPSKLVNVALKRRPLTQSGYIITVKGYKIDTDDEGNIIQEYPNNKHEMYFKNFDLSNNFIFDYPKSVIFEEQGKVYASAEDAAADVQAIQDVFTADPKQYVGTTFCYVYEVVAEFSTVTVPQRKRFYPVRLGLEYERYQAKRKAIGIRDVSASYDLYTHSSTLVSKVFNFDSQIESLMLDVDATIDNQYLDSIDIQYFVSLNDSRWIKLSPIQSPTSGVAEVLIFNKNISNEYKIAGVGYLNYPEIPSTINSVKVKIEISKSRNVNYTPTIRSFKLIAGIKQV
jgi:hypothetical protein